MNRKVGSTVGASPEAASAGQVKPGGANWTREEAGAGPYLGLSPLFSYIDPCMHSRVD